MNAPTLSLYDQLLGLLGLRTDSLEFTMLRQTVGEPDEISELGVNEYFIFNNYGFLIGLRNADQRFWILSFEFRNVAVQPDSLMRSFDHVLYAGIKPTDTPEDVEEKLGVKPIRFEPSRESDIFRAEYKVPPYGMVCCYKHANGLASLHWMNVWLLNAK